MAELDENAPQVVAVLGGAGLLGSHIVSRLLELEYARKHRSSDADGDQKSAGDTQDNINGDSASGNVVIEGQDARERAMLAHAAHHPGKSSSVAEIRVFDMKPFDLPDLRLDFAPEDAGVTLKTFTGSITDRDAVREVLQGCTEVYQCISVVDIRSRNHVPKSLMAVNVGGNRSVLELSREFGVRRLVYTSSLDASLHKSHREMHDGDEDNPLPPDKVEDFLAGAYGQTKAWAEQDVFKADNAPSDGSSSSPRLRTVVVRSVGLYGDRDAHHINNFLAAAESGLLKARIGDGTALYNHAYAGNVAWGHVCAMNTLRSAPDSCAGKLFYVKDDSPDQSFFDFMDPYVRGRGMWMPPKWCSLPYSVMWYIALLLETVRAIVEPFYKFETNITPFSVSTLTAIHLFSDARARSVLKYRPIFSVKEARALSMAYFGCKDPDLEEEK